MEQVLENLLEYGILGMWTISLLVSKYQGDKNHGKQMDKFHDEYTHVPLVQSIQVSSAL